MKCIFVVGGGQWHFLVVWRESGSLWWKCVLFSYKYYLYGIPSSVESEIWSLKVQIQLIKVQSLRYSNAIVKNLWLSKIPAYFSTILHKNACMKLLLSNSQSKENRRLVGQVLSKKKKKLLIVCITILWISILIFRFKCKQCLSIMIKDHLAEYAHSKEYATQIKESKLINEDNNFVWKDTSVWMNEGSSNVVACAAGLLVEVSNLKCFYFILLWVILSLGGYWHFVGSLEENWYKS